MVLAKMAEETEDINSKEELSEDVVPTKPKLKLKMPDPMIFFFIGPFVIIFVIYIVLTKIFLTSDLKHEEKLEQVLNVNIEGQMLEKEQSEGEDVTNQEAGGFLDIHNYFQFPMSFAVNVPNTNKNLTFELAVSSFQSGVTAEWFFDNFTAFVPALRSDILYFMGGHSLEDLQSSEFQASLLLDLKDVINAKLESLGAKPEISKVLFVTFVIT